MFDINELDIIDKTVKRTNHLFVIAIDDYEHFSTLGNAVKDGKDFIDLVTTKFDFEPKNVKRLFNKEATKSKINQQLKKYADKESKDFLTPNDNLVIYFSGHGTYEKVIDRGYWIPVSAKKGDETDYVPSSDITVYLDVIKAHHIFVIADACFSESFFIDTKNRAGDVASAMEKNASRWGLTSGRGLVSDGIANQNSPFAQNLLDLLRKTEQAIGVQELAHKVSVATYLSKPSQKPHGQPLAVKGHDFGQFVFKIKNFKTLSAEDTAFEKALADNSKESLRGYLNTYPKGIYIEEANQQLQVIEKYEAEQRQRNKEIDEYKEWEKILMRERQRTADYEDYLVDFEKAIFEKQAYQMIDALAWKVICDAVKKYQDTQQKGKFYQYAEELLKTKHWQIIHQNIQADYLKHKDTLDFKKHLRKPTARFEQKKITKPAIIETSVGNFLFIKGGTFLMGSPENEVNREATETQHEVKLSDFYMAKYTVTLEEFEQFIQAVNYQTDADKYGSSYIWTGSKWEDTKGVNWKCDVNGKPQTDKQHPVIHVSWNDAKAYAKWLSEKHQVPFDLPTEAQWEYACRAGTSTPFNTGKNLTTEQANYDGNYPYNGNAKGKYLQKTTKVGSYPPNSFGLYDMHGNVWEWCQDCYGEKYYEECKQQGIVENPVGPESGSSRVLRGGSWLNYAQFCRSANRLTYAPDRRNSDIGFRLVCSPVS